MAKKLKSYSNLYAEIEEQTDGTWIVINKVVGFAVSVGGDGKDCDNPTKIFPNYASARAAMVEIYQHYKSLGG